MNAKKPQKPVATLKKKKQNIGKEAGKNPENIPGILLRGQSQTKESTSNTVPDKNKNKVSTFTREPTHFRSISPSLFTRLAASTSSNASPSTKQVSFSGLKNTKNRDEEYGSDSENSQKKSLVGQNSGTGLIDIGGTKKGTHRRKSRSMSVHEARAALSLSHTPFLKVVSLDEPQNVVSDQSAIGAISHPPVGSTNNRTNLDSIGKEILPGTSAAYRRRTFSTCGSCVK